MLTISVFYPASPGMPNKKVSKTANTIGLKVSTKKTQVLRKNTRLNDPVMIDGKHLEDVEEFSYLGT